MLEWRDNNLPVSKRFDDPYYSKQDGRAETEYVFIKSNNLTQRWPTMDKCVIAELGFGTGLNFHRNRSTLAIAQTRSGQPKFHLV